VEERGQGQGRGGRGRGPKSSEGGEEGVGDGGWELKERRDGEGRGGERRKKGVVWSRVVLVFSSSKAISVQVSTQGK